MKLFSYKSHNPRRREVARGGRESTPSKTIPENSTIGFCFFWAGNKISNHSINRETLNPELDTLWFARVNL